ncbi:MAG: polyhydroxyalkanoate synthesis repressor PhaR [Legionellales bacterium]|jgi:polyhydroxyalkanoate synthesis repressor PhaR|nr:polyhydroxyalkanoate synthesis repressor PhaR [Legionellales bacterium]|tara:strand:+ start:1504 stop:1848 length:345 start_codon:yes stop_codon:yes gene_type:complete
MEKKMSRIIKKYPNRRLYDTKLSKYITLESVKKLVVENEKFIIEDTKSKKNLTKNILLQIISEQEENTKPLFSSELLFHFIRFYDDLSKIDAVDYLKKSFDMLEVKKNIENKKI